MTYYDEERIKQEVRNRLRLERLKQVRLAEKQISLQNSNKYLQFKSESKQVKQELISKRHQQEELTKLNTIIRDWNQAVLQTGKYIGIMFSFHFLCTIHIL
jgi:uncharacterized protein YcbK (DUF882 family)